VRDWSVGNGGAPVNVDWRRGDAKSARAEAAVL